MPWQGDRPGYAQPAARARPKQRTARPETFTTGLRAFQSLSPHRTLEGIVLITALGAGLATVLIMVGLVTVRLRRSVAGASAGGELRLVRRLPGMGGWLARAADRALAWLARSLRLLAPCMIAALGLVLVFWGLLSAGIIGP